ncbi:uncharacterized protein LOC126293664 [Schistocerca gregaria]|uniref:uncharacterized protein LOC126293664 n=1 Tax=Schistocerca gregaria TaxID=7010 RepID=UPI00211E395E|nr:uncharacterized protein LOC126293664 [Schistocerca gregaria]
MAGLKLLAGFFLAAYPLLTSGNGSADRQLTSVSPGDNIGAEEIPVVCPCIQFSPTVFDCSQHLLETRPDDVTEPYEGMTPSQYLGDEDIDATTASPPDEVLSHREDMRPTEVSPRTYLDQYNSGLATTLSRHNGNGVGLPTNQAFPRKRTIRSLRTPGSTRGDTPSLDVYRLRDSQPGSNKELMGGIPSIYKLMGHTRDDKMPKDLKTVASKFIERIVKDTHSRFDVLRRLSLQFINANRGWPTSNFGLQQRGESTLQLAGNEETPVTGGILKEVPGSDLNHRRNTRYLLPVLATTVTKQHDTGVSTSVNEASPRRRAIRRLNIPQLTKVDPHILGVYRRGSSQSRNKESLNGGTASSNSGFLKPVEVRREVKVDTDRKTVASTFIEKIVEDTHSAFEVLRRLALQFITAKRGRPAASSSIKKMAEGTSQLPEEEPTLTGSALKDVSVSDLNHHRNSRNIPAIYQTLVDTFMPSQDISRTLHLKERPLDGRDPAAEKKENYKRTPHHLVNLGHSLYSKGPNNRVSEKESQFEISRKSISVGNKLRNSKEQKSTSPPHVTIDPKVSPGAVIPGCVPDNVETLHMGATKLGHITNLTFSYLTKLVFLSLNDSGVVSVSKDTFRSNNDLEELILDWNHISTLHEHTLQNNPKLRVFSALMTRLSTVDSRFFDHCPLLESVAISNNLEDIPPTLFRHSPLLRYVDLHFNWLTDIPESIFFWSPQLEWVDLSYNSISELPESLFFNSGQLRSVNLSHNRIWSLQEDTFSMTPLLEVLKLDVNELSVMPPKTLAKLPALKELTLRGNHLSHLHEETFSANRELRVLDLSYNNIESLPEGILHNLLDLRQLLLTGNLLTTLGSATFVNNGKLVKLNLDINRIPSLPQGMFHFTPELKSLHLESNEISFIDVDAFEKTAKLQELDLSTNKLSNLTEVLLAVGECHNIKTLSLLNNPWTCECGNGQYIEILRKFKTESLYCVSAVGLIYDDFEEFLKEPECTVALEKENEEGRLMKRD